MKLDNGMTVRKGYVLRGSIAMRNERAKGEKTPGETLGRNWFGENGKYIWGLSCFPK